MNGRPAHVQRRQNSSLAPESHVIFSHVVNIFVLSPIFLVDRGRAHSDPDWSGGENPFKDRLIPSF